MLERDTIYLGGAWTGPATPEALDVVGPATEQVVARVPMCGQVDVDRAVDAARAAFPHWSRTPPGRRAAVLAAVRDVLDARREDLAAVVTTELGAPARQADALHVGLPLQVLSSYVELLAWHAFESRIGHSTVFREPAGVVAAITSWDHPVQQAVAKLAAALAAGCTVVLKPSSLTPLSAFFLAEVMHEAEVPGGVVNVVTGAGPVIGAALASHPGVDVVSFTGSTWTGRTVAAAAAGQLKRTLLELDGTSVSLALPDADLAPAVLTTMARAFGNAGQARDAMHRLLVPRSQVDDALALAKEAADQFPVGPPDDPRTRVGPLVSAAVRDRARGLVDDAVSRGARVVAGGSAAPAGLGTGFYLTPTVLGDVSPDWSIAREPFFGPVLSVLPYADLDDAVGLVRGTGYGLSAAVWSADQERALAVARRLRCGQVDVNGARPNPRAPSGGFGRSGYGRELGVEGLQAFCELTSVQM